MFRVGAPLVAAILLAGCETQPVHEMSYSEQQKWGQKIVLRCFDQGIKKNPQLNDCIKAEMVRDVSLRRSNAVRKQRAGEAINDYMQDRSNYYNSMSAASAARNVNCRSVRAADGSLNTNCH